MKDLLKGFIHSLLVPISSRKK